MHWCYFETYEARVIEAESGFVMSRLWIHPHSQLLGEGLKPGGESPQRMRLELADVLRTEK